MDNTFCYEDKTLENVTLIMTLCGFIAVISGHMLQSLYLDGRLRKTDQKQLRWTENANTGRINNHDDLKGFLMQMRTTMMHMLKDIQEKVYLKTTYPIELRGSLLDEQSDFAIICRIVHWNMQWISEHNSTLKPS